jgi:hypothetical protein
MGDRALEEHGTESCSFGISGRMGHR